MSNDPTLSEPARRLIRAMARFPMPRKDLMSLTKLTDSKLSAALNELLKQELVEHVGYSNDPSGGMWQLTSDGQSAKEQFQTGFLATKIPDGSRVLRPPPQDLRTQLWLLGFVSLLYAFLLWGVLVWSWQWAILILFLLTCVWLGLLIATIATWMSVTRITPTEVITRTWFGGVHKTPRTSIARAVIVYVRGTRRGWKWLLLLNAQGRCLRRMQPLGDSRSFAGQFGVPVTDATSQTRSLSQLRREFPGSVAWARLPGPFLLITMGVLLLAILAVILILAATGILQPPKPPG